jgi:Ca2+-transporting ATPase
LGEVVAVTGDGTNDSPALREADVGFAMGISGTEVAKDASDIVLMDDNFSSIVKAVLWGRNVYDSIRKFVQFQLTVNIVAVLVACIGALTDGESPLKAVQLLWVNLIMDTMAALALATEPPTPQLLDRPPYGRFSPLITTRMWRLILGQAAYQLFVCFFILGYGHHWKLLATHDNDEVKQTIIFNAFVWCQIFNEFNARKLENEPNMFENLFGNWIFVSVMAFTVVVQVILVQWAGEAFKTHALTGNQWAFCIVVGFISIPIGLIIRFIPVPPDRVPTPEEIAKKNAKRAKGGDEKPLLVSEKEVELLDMEKAKAKADSKHQHTIDIEKKEGAESPPDSPEADRRGSLPPSNWDVAASVLTQVRVVSAFRKPVRGSTYGGNFKV